MGLVAWYELKQNTIDKSTYNINAIPYNVLWENYGPLRFANFNGQDSYIQIDNHNEINTRSIYNNKSISLMFYALDDNDLQVLYKQGDVNSGIVIYIYQKYIYLGIFNNNTGYNLRGSYISAFIEKERWYNVVFQTQTGNYILGYLNGVNFNKKEAAPLSGSNSNNYIGQNDITCVEHINLPITNSCNFHGYMQDFKYYNICLNEKFIYNYSESFLPSTKIILPNQIKSVEAHKQSIYNYIDLDSNVYISRELNHFNNIAGNDFILNGLNIQSAIINQDNLEVKICPGILIQDLTLIEVKEFINLEMQLEGEGTYLIHTEYSFSENNQNNPFRIYCQYLNDDIYWDINKTKVILAIIEYYNNELILKNDSISISDKVYYVRGINKFNMIYDLFELNRHYDVFSISEANLINKNSNSYGSIIKKRNKTVFSENGNLIILSANPYYDSRYLLYDISLKDIDNNNYNLFTENGNLFLVNSNKNMETQNPNIKDIGCTFKFIHTQYNLITDNKNLKLSTPNNVHSLCEKKLYEYDIDINTNTTSNISGIGSDFGYICGGYNNTHISYITRFQFSIDSGKIQNKSNLSGSKYGLCGINSTTHGYVCGGHVSFLGNTTHVRDIDKFNFPFGVGDSFLHSNILFDDRTYSCANNSSMYGYVCGGIGKQTSERFNFPLQSNTLSSIHFMENREYNASHNCTNYGYVVGSDNVSLNCKFNRYLFSLESTSVSDTYVTIETVKKEISGCNSTQHGYVFGNYNDQNNNILKFLFTTGSITIINDSLQKSQTSSNNSTQYGYLCLGKDINTNTIINNISKINFSNDGFTEDYLNLGRGRIGSCAIDGVDFASMFI